VQKEGKRSGAAARKQWQRCATEMKQAAAEAVDSSELTSGMACAMRKRALERPSHCMKVLRGLLRTRPACGLSGRDRVAGSIAGRHSKAQHGKAQHSKAC